MNVLDVLEKYGSATAQVVCEIQAKRADLALRAFRQAGDGLVEHALTRDEFRAVLLPALGLEESTE